MFLFSYVLFKFSITSTGTQCICCVFVLVHGTFYCAIIYHSLVHFSVVMTVSDKI